MSQQHLLAALVNPVLAIAQRAGDAILGVYGQMLAAADGQVAAAVTFKDDGSPLTQADLLAHALIAGELAGLTPGIPVVSEEDDASQRHRLTTGQFWLVDPLDGTREFMARNGEFTVNIALIRDGRPVLGVVHAPALAQTYWGSHGAGAWRCTAAGTPEPIRVVPPHQPLRVVASKSHLNQETQAFIAALGPHQLVQAGSSLKICRVAEGLADVYPRLGPTCEWDTAAAQAVLEAADGHVLGPGGTPLHYGKPDKLNPYFVAASSAQFQLTPS